MKKPLSVFALLVCLAYACKKSTKRVIDCFGESLLMSIRSTADAGNAKIINLETHYSGSHTVKSVAWTFGDGATATTATKSTQHTYSTAGNYTVKAVVTISNGDGACSIEPTKAIIVN